MSGVTTLGSNVETGAPVRLNAEARQRGSYVVGLTGTGKTTLLLNIVVADMEAGDGLCLLDPHGDLTEDLLVRVPEHRERDVILFDPADVDRPFGLNLFECADPANPHAVDLVCSQALGTFWKLFH
jgi:DNA helicase HerA-like ATPase